MNLSCSYLGLNLHSPLIVGSGPFDTPKSARDCQTAGAAMLVMHSLFEEQFAAERAARYWSMEHASGPEEYEMMMEVDPADLSFFGLTPEEYFERLASLKKTLSIPVAGSINGTSPGNWVLYAQEMEKAGADAIELNLYDPIMDTSVKGARVEEHVLEIVRLVRKTVTKVPLAVKLCPFYSSVGNLIQEIDALGADGIVMFNRFYQPDFDISGAEPKTARDLNLSASAELPLRLRWTAALYGRIRANIAIAGGVHTGADAVKSVLAGADAVQVVSAIMRRGANSLSAIRDEMSSWLTQRGVSSLDVIRGRMSLQKVLNPETYDRANYVGIIREQAANAEV
ncbi:MAG TPA: dihydroorotate dehydrogenase-like protein [Phycisphaerae bacterium]|nr:dihydroorotate dehydrogenase-like protein [Phycisphaerae bacterium]